MAARECGYLAMHALGSLGVEQRLPVFAEGVERKLMGEVNRTGEQLERVGTGSNLGLRELPIDQVSKNRTYDTS